MKNTRAAALVQHEKATHARRVGSGHTPLQGTNMVGIEMRQTREAVSGLTAGTPKPDLGFSLYM